MECCRRPDDWARRPARANSPMVALIDRSSTDNSALLRVWRALARHLKPKRTLVSGNLLVLVSLYLPIAVDSFSAIASERLKNREKQADGSTHHAVCLSQSLVNRQQRGRKSGEKECAKTVPGFGADRSKAST